MVEFLLLPLLFKTDTMQKIMSFIIKIWYNFGIITVPFTKISRVIAVVFEVTLKTETLTFRRRNRVNSGRITIKVQYIVSTYSRALRLAFRKGVLLSYLFIYITLLSHYYCFASALAFKFLYKY